MTTVLTSNLPYTSSPSEKMSRINFLSMAYFVNGRSPGKGSPILDVVRSGIVVLLLRGVQVHGSGGSGGSGAMTLLLSCMYPLESLCCRICRPSQSELSGVLTLAGSRRLH